MDHAASVLLGFPPEAPLTSDDFYDQEINYHIKKVDRLFHEEAVVTGERAAQLLTLLDPAVNSLSYLAVLDSLQDCEDLAAEARSTALIDFFCSFDPRQIRYVGSMFTSLLKTLADDQYPLPHDVKVGVLSTAILRLNPSGSMLTDNHLVLARLAYNTDTAEHVFSVIDKQIVYFPSMSKEQIIGNGKQKLLCDMSLPAPEYITVEAGLTLPLKDEEALEYDLLCGLLYCSRQQWEKARTAFELVITHPTRDGGVSKIMMDAYTKWLLVSLLVNGRTPEVPSIAGFNARKTYETMGKPYQAIASHFDKMTAVPLKKEVEANVQTWQGDRNTGLVQQVLAAHQKWQIMDLRNVYSKVSLSDIRRQTCSAETGDCLTSDDEIEKLVQGMIESGMLKGVVEKPEGKPPYLTFLSESDELSEAQYQKEIAVAFQKMKELKEIYRATNNRLSTNPYWLKHILREQKREKENGAQGLALHTFDSQVEDEDLMSGVMTDGI